MYAGKRRYDEVGSRELCRRKGRGHRQRYGASGPPSGDSGWCVLDDYARTRFGIKALRGTEIPLRRRFAIYYIFSGDHDLRDRKAHMREPQTRERPTARGHHGATGVGKRGQTGLRTRECHEPHRVIEFSRREPLHLSVSVECWGHLAYGVDAAPAMGALDEIRDGEFVASAPMLPRALHHGTGIDEHAVQVEEDRAALDHSVRHGSMDSPSPSHRRLGVLPNG